MFTRVHSCSFVFTRVHSCSGLCGVLDMIGLTIENVIFCRMCNFYLIQAKNRQLKVRFVFCDFPRRDVKCRR